MSDRDSSFIICQIICYIMNIAGLLSPLQLPPELQSVQSMLQQGEHFLRSDSFHKRSSRASDTSSAYSGSDLMQSSLDDQDVDFTGLRESMVDSDEEEGYDPSGTVSFSSARFPGHRECAVLWSV